MPKDQIIVSLDIGSSKISCVVATVDKSKISVIGAYSHPSKGIKDGVVNNIDKAVESIAETLNKAEMMSGHPISRVAVTLSGTHIESLNSHGVVAITGPDSEITLEDIARVNEAARATSLPSSREIMHVIPREYIVDKQKGISDPTGMSGQRLEVEANIVHGSTSNLKNLSKCIQQVGVEIDNLIYAGYASAEAVLTDTEKELGTVLIDIGGGTIDLIIYTRGAPAYSAVLPIGGQDITSDLAIGLRSLLEDAEKVKIKLSSEPEHGNSDLVIDRDGHENKVPKGEIYVGDLNLGMETVPKAMLNDIMHRRLLEAFKFVQIYIKKAGYDKRIPAGVVITGGTAQIKNIVNIASSVFDLPVRIGVPMSVTGLVDQIQGPAFSANIGALQIVYNSLEEDTRTYGRRNGSMGGVGGRLVNFIKSFLP